MPIDVLQTLINKQDTFEIVRDQLAAILVSEIANQQTLAEEADLNPDDWKVRIFTEQSNPFSVFQCAEGSAPEDRSPICNIWYDGGDFDMARSNVVEKQLHNMRFNFDIYGFGITREVEGGGHTPGDQVAALETQRALRLIRNILMAGPNTYLQLRGTVWRRMPSSMQMFQPKMNEMPVQNVLGCRLTMLIEGSEYSPQFTPEIVELFTIALKRKEDGEVYLNFEYEYNTT